MSEALALTACLSLLELLPALFGGGGWLREEQETSLRMLLALLVLVLLVGGTLTGMRLLPPADSETREDRLEVRDGNVEQEGASEVDVKELQRTGKQEVNSK